MDERAAYTVRPFPLSRRLIMDSGRAGRRQHTVTGLVELDVTEALRRIERHEARTGERLSFTAFFVHCLAEAIDHDRTLHARRDLLGRLVLFEEVDCTVMIEIELEGRKFPLGHILRAANKRPMRSLHEEIRRVQADPPSSGSLQKSRLLLGAFLRLPRFVRDLVYRVGERMPRLFKRQAGTVIVSAVGMFGTGGGWGLTYGSPYTCGVLLGGMAKKPAVVEGRVEVRDVLCVTLDFDHDIVDGAPAARFVQRLEELVAAGSGLPD